MAGQTVKTVLSNKLEAKGEYSLNTGDIHPGAGIYFATLMLEGDQGASSVTVKLVKIR